MILLDARRIRRSFLFEVGKLREHCDQSHLAWGASASSSVRSPPLRKLYSEITGEGPRDRF